MFISLFIVERKYTPPYCAINATGRIFNVDDPIVATMLVVRINIQLSDISQRCHYYCEEDPLPHPLSQYYEQVFRSYFAHPKGLTFSGLWAYAIAEHTRYNLIF